MKNGDLSNEPLKQVYLDIDSFVANGEFDVGLLETVPVLFDYFDIKIWAPLNFFRKWYGERKFLLEREELQYGQIVTYSKTRLKIALRLEKATLLTSNYDYLKYFGKYARHIILLRDLQLVTEIRAKDEIEQINWFNRMAE